MGGARGNEERFNETKRRSSESGKCSSESGTR